MCQTLIGGMSVQKQERLIALKPIVILGTPGRILDLVKDFSTLKKLVIDEADKMLQQGQFADLIKLTQAINTQSKP